jgi:hypothetical protein
MKRNHSILSHTQAVVSHLRAAATQRYAYQPYDLHRRITIFKKMKSPEKIFQGILCCTDERRNFPAQYFCANP